MESKQAMLLQNGTVSKLLANALVLAFWACTSLWFLKINTQMCLHVSAVIAEKSEIDTVSCVRELVKLDWKSEVQSCSHSSHYMVCLDKRNSYQIPYEFPNYYSLIVIFIYSLLHFKEYTFLLYFTLRKMFISTYSIHQKIHNFEWKVWAK